MNYRKEQWRDRGLLTLKMIEIYIQNNQCNSLFSSTDGCHGHRRYGVKRYTFAHRREYNHREHDSRRRSININIDVRGLKR